MAVPIPAQKPEQKPQPEKQPENNLKAEAVNMNAENEKHKEAIAAPKETDRLICGSCGKETKSRERCTECGTEFE